MYACIYMYVCLHCENSNYENLITNLIPESRIFKFCDLRTTVNEFLILNKCARMYV